MIYAPFVLLGILIHPISAEYNATQDELKRGWVGSPDGRGTFDILWSCLFTIFLCTWTVLHLNIPAPHETYYDFQRRKARWMVQALMAPEFVLIFATGQKVDARKSVQQFKEIGYDQWTIRHGFYANMGGFRLVTGDGLRFPVNANHILYLVKHNYIEFPSMTSKDIWDKSKADGFQKVLTCLQSIWFIIQFLGRAAQQLPITTLELSVLGFVICTLAMYVQWANKPLDVESSTVIRMEATMETVLREAEQHGKNASQPYKSTPMDFVDNLKPSWISEVQPYLPLRFGPPQRPIPRFTNDRFPVIGASLDAIILFWITMIYVGLHFGGWNFSFPTSIEKWLWRASSIVIFASAKIFWICETIQDGRRTKRWQNWHKALFPQRAPNLAAVMDAEKVAKEEPFIPLWEVCIMTPVTFLYSAARTYIMVEIFLSQRALPAGAFLSVQWSNFIPHY